MHPERVETMNKTHTEPAAQNTEPHTRSVLALFADRRIQAGQAAQELGLGRISFMELLKQRGIPHATYTTEDWESDAKAIDAFERRRKAE